MESILTSIKKLLGLEEEYEQFDTDIIMHINSVFFVLMQLGVGPKEGFSISDKYAKWSDFIPGNEKLQVVKSYMHLKVRLLFDPPTSAALIAVIENSIKEFEFRLNVEANTTNGEEGIQNG